jgi:hypothetical protein
VRRPSLRSLRFRRFSAVGCAGICPRPEEFLEKHFAWVGRRSMARNHSSGLSGGTRTSSIPAAAFTISSFRLTTGHTAFSTFRAAFESVPLKMSSVVASANDSITVEVLHGIHVARNDSDQSGRDAASNLKLKHHLYAVGSPLVL